MLVTVTAVTLLTCQGICANTVVLMKMTMWCISALLHVFSQEFLPFLLSSVVA